MYNRKSFINEAETTIEIKMHSSVPHGRKKIARCTKFRELSQFDKQVVNSYYSFVC